MIQHILNKAVAGQRLSQDEGLALLESRDLVALGRAALLVSRRLHPEPYRTYNIDRNINYTNICTAVCDFCAFYRSPKSDEGYVLPREVLLDKVRETVELGGNQILLQGGLHPTLDLSWYEELLQDIKRDFPQVNVHGFSPPEIYHFTKVAKLPLREVLERLQAAGLGSIPGRRCRDSGRSRAPGNHPWQSDDRRLAGGDARVARAGWTQFGDHDVRACRDLG